MVMPLSRECGERRVGFLALIHVRLQRALDGWSESLAESSPQRSDARTP